MKKRIAAVFLFLLLFLGSVAYCQEIVKAKFMNDSTTIVDGFYTEKKHTIDVVFIGSSNCFCTVDPLVLYENYGITSYDFASSSQPMEISLLYMKEVFKRQSPKVIALEVNYLPGASLDLANENSLRWGLTDIPLSLQKIACLNQCFEQLNGDYVSYLFPILRYHERWKELSKNDFTYQFADKTNWSKGYLHTQEVAQTPVNLSDFESEGESWVEERIVACLDEMVDICKKNNASLLLFKSPRAEWYSYQSALVKQLAQERGCPFLDYNQRIEEIGLDVTTDFRDAEHLNDQGAYKVSNDLGAFLKAQYELPERRNDGVTNSFDQSLAYYERLEPQPFMEAKTVMECNDLLAKEEGYVMIVTYRGNLSSKSKQKVAPHQWVYDEHKLVMEQEWLEDGVRMKDIDNIQIVLRKKGVNTQVLVNNIDYQTVMNNWTVIVYDKVTEQVAARLGYDS